MQHPGFEKIIDCSDNISCFKTLHNEQHPFKNIQPRTQIEDRKIAHNVADISQLSRLAIGTLHQELLQENAEDDIEYNGLVLSSSNPEHHAGGLENVAKQLADMYGIEHASSLNYACSGFPAAVEEAIKMAADNPSAKRILIITAEILSKIVDWSDENTSILFGDGVAITSIVPNGQHEIIDAWARGNIDDPKKCLRMESKTETTFVDGSIDPNERDIIVMDGGKILYKTVPQSLLELVYHSKVGIEGTDRIVPHQANGKFIEYMIRLLRKQDKDKQIPIMGTIAHHGNSASASIPRALAATKDLWIPGEVIACPAKGAGINYEEGKLTEGLVLFTAG